MNCLQLRNIGFEDSELRESPLDLQLARRNQWKMGKLLVGMATDKFSYRLWQNDLKTA